MTKTHRLTPAHLNQFTGTENYYRHGLNPQVLFTDGAKHVADEGGAYWLLDLIAIAQRYNKPVASEEFQVWCLKVQTDRSATLTAENGNGLQVHTQRVEWTDFPVETITLWYENNVIYLPSER